MMAAATETPEALSPLAVSPRQAARLLQVSVPTMYGLLHTGRVHSVVAGRRRLVSVASLRALIDGEAT